MLYLANIGIWEMLPILVVVLVLFGAKKLPELARAMGSSINMFKKGLADGDDAPELPEASAGPRDLALEPPAREATVVGQRKTAIESGEPRSS